MVYIKTFHEFFSQAQALYKRDPKNTRYTFKFRPKDQRLVLKVTDDRVCVKFKTESQSDVKNLEVISNWFFAQTTTRSDDEAKADH